MKKIKLLYLSWSLVLLIIIQITMDGNHENISFQGSAETREVVVNSENAVEIRNIHVVSGQVVPKGRLLAELERPDLLLKINESSHRLEELKLQDNINQDELRSRIDQLKAEKKEIKSESDYKINQLQSRYNLNKELTAGLQSIRSENQGLKEKKRSPVEIEIEGLKKDQLLRIRRIKLEIDTLKKCLELAENPIRVQIEGLEKELKLLLAEKKKLLIYARMDGVIGSVLCKRGEKVSPFVPILTMYKQAPSYVKAFIHEKVHHLVSPGGQVHVMSLTGSNKRVIADIVGTGSRIVEFPPRLKKRPDIQIWGREVEIRLPEENSFLLGEKVMVYSLENSDDQYLARLYAWGKQWLNLNLYAAEAKDQNEKSNGLIDIMRSKSLGKIPEVEASGLIYLEDLDKFLLVSDETEKKAPVLYLMDQDAMVREKITIRGMNRIDDMEAICHDDKGHIYIASSQSQNKKGKLPDHRKILVRARRDGTNFEAEQQIFLYDRLKDAAAKKADADWARFITDQDIEIEGMFYAEQALYLGCKKPLKNKRAAILRINDIEKVMREKQINADNVEIWRELDLQEEISASPAGISDLIFHEGRLYVLSAVKYKNETGGTSKLGALRVYDGQGKNIQTKHFYDLNPEGIAFDSERKNLVITFDQGKNSPSKMIRMEVVQ